MEVLCDTMNHASRSLWRWFFPKRIQPPECVLGFLQVVYPTVDWGRVRFYEGWPHVIGFSPNTAITLPDTYTPHRINVYFKPGRWNPCDGSGLGLLAHEGFHALQICDVLNGFGLGFARPFLAQYLACWAANGFKYPDHPMENAAYGVAGRSTSLVERCCESTRLPCDCSAGPPSVDETGLRDFERHCAGVVQKTSGIDFWRDVADSTPKLRGRYTVFGVFSLLWLLLWSGVTLALWLLKIVIELAGVVACGLLWSLTGIACVLDWGWQRLVGSWNKAQRRR